MSKFLLRPPSAEKHQEDGLQHIRKDLKLLKSTFQVGQSLVIKNPERAVQQAVLAGLKMASHPFYDSAVNPLRLIDELKKLGLGVLGWSPETLMANIDQKFGDWSSEQVAEALEHFHKTGMIKTRVPQLVREKIYAIRVVATSNSAQTGWHLFEKIGGAFNDRIAQFGTVEPLSAAECARTVAIIENIRPDAYENEVKIYIAASCHEDGLYTVSPVKWLSMAETYLQQMNSESMGEGASAETIKAVADKLVLYRTNKHTVREVPDDLVSIQASKLLGIDEYAEEALKDI